MLSNWSKSGNAYKIAEVSQQMKHLPVGVYKYQLDVFEQPFLAQISDKFELPGKIYNTERSFIDRVKKTWANTTGNLGILLNGIKGTGKSVTAEIICNEIDLPVIIIPFKHKSLISFINDIQQNVVIFIDEYDKVFDRYDNSLLSVMDGVLKKDNRCMFLLTSNDAMMERNMLQRPSRIRYVKTFGDLSLDAIIEIVDDMLIHKHLRDETIKFISYLSIITMDLVKSIVEEINIHNEMPQAFENIFNINDGNSQKNDVYLIKNGKKELVAQLSEIYPKTPFTDYYEDDDFSINRNYIGLITQVTSPNEIVVEVKLPVVDGQVQETELQTFLIEKSEKQHKVFHNYDLIF